MITQILDGKYFTQNTTISLNKWNHDLWNYATCLQSGSSDVINLVGELSVVLELIGEAWLVFCPISRGNYSTSKMSDSVCIKYGCIFFIVFPLFVIADNSIRKTLITNIKTPSQPLDSPWCSIYYYHNVFFSSLLHITQCIEWYQFNKI